MKNKYRVFLLGVFLSLSSLAFADAIPVNNLKPNQVEYWLSKMHRAAHMSNYQGIFVYGQKDNLSSMKIIHRADATGERERLLSLDGTGREVLRNKNSVTCILPKSKSVIVEKSRPTSDFPPAFPMKINELSAIYKFSLSAIERVAGRKTQKVIITPKDEYRYGHVLWIDFDSGLLLKTHLMNETGKVVEKFMFTQIDFMKSIPDELLNATISGENFTWYESKDEKHTTKMMSSATNWAVKSLPKGFKADMNRKHVMPRSGVAMEHLMYSDGLSSISVFIEKENNKNNQLIGRSEMGAINACGRALDSGVHITVVGEVTQAAVMLICNSVYQKK